MHFLFHCFFPFLLFSSQYIANADTIANAIECIETEYSFGDINPSDIPISHTFNIKNISTTSFYIEHVSTTCSCVSASWDSKKIRPGDTGKIILFFTDNHKDGEFNKLGIVYVSTLKQPFALRIKGNIRKTRD